MLYIQSWQSIIHIFQRESGDEEEQWFPHTRASLVFESDRLESQRVGRGLWALCGSPPPPPNLPRDNIQIYMDIYVCIYIYIYVCMGLLTMLICSHMPLQGSKYLAVGREHQMRRSLSDLVALPDCGASGMSFPISLSVVVRAGQTAVLSSLRPFYSDDIFQHVKTLDRNALMDVFCFFVVVFFKRELY